MEKVRPNLSKIEKDQRHIQNLLGFTGYWHGMYFLLGVVKKRFPEKIPSSVGFFLCKNDQRHKNR